MISCGRSFSKQIKPTMSATDDPAHNTFTKSARAKTNAALIDALPFGRLWYDTPENAIGYAMHSSRSHTAVIRVYDVAGNVIETHEHAGDFKFVLDFNPAFFYGRF